ncbi:hypothetical protein [Chitinophaga sancti]|uniref:Lipoprotein n=1 Tax=Chitinophaga sancti TaxID=1004 RepID=A0A1K1PUF2_9BACT|nr:hypothetical protein [Chitinophaga sancti]WQD61635.1 hypothetical protein U0033_27525 [Chitinophaga sancti]WQG92808.1 hypothetical protein SR876_14915 [Chitinophaga sancti]SFW51101.1 hypothetical protein SAMN05661012_02235 [Chitinophaga sancti]
MKNALKIGFLALALGVFATACGGNSGENATDSTAAATTQNIDSVANAAQDSIAAKADTAKAAVDSVAAAAKDTAAKH